jgi:hypothetical protein
MSRALRSIPPAIMQKPTSSMRSEKSLSIARSPFRQRS